MSIPYRFRVEGFFRYENPDRHEKEIEEQAKRDARDKTRLRVEKDVFWVGFFGLVGLLFTLQQTRISTEAVTKQFELSERPWIAVDLIAIRPLVFEGSSLGSVWVQFAMKNLGHSPALSTQVQQLKVVGPFVRKEDPQISGRSLLSVAVVGCVEYEFTFAQGFHQTGFFFDPVKLDSDEPQVWHFIELPKAAAQVDPVGFRRDAFGSYAY